MIVQTPTCAACGKAGTVELTDEQVNALTNNTGLIQNDLPDVPASIREQLMTGTHSECWDRVFAEPEY